MAKASGALHAQLDVAPEEDAEAADELADQQVSARTEQQCLQEHALPDSLKHASRVLCVCECTAALTPAPGEAVDRDSKCA